MSGGRRGRDLAAQRCTITSPPAPGRVRWVLPWHCNASPATRNAAALHWRHRAQGERGALLAAVAYIGGLPHDGSGEAEQAVDAAAAVAPPGAPYGPCTAAEVAVRQAKERLDYQAWLLLQGGEAGGPGGTDVQRQYEPGEVARVVLLVAGADESSR